MGFGELAATRALSKTRNHLSRAAALLLQQQEQAEDGATVVSTEGEDGGSSSTRAWQPENSSQWLVQSREIQRLMSADNIAAPAAASISATSTPPSAPRRSVLAKLSGLLRRSPNNQSGTSP
jgi:hypothetical protein